MKEQSTLMDPKALLYRDGVLLPARIELQESSGPVAPKFQYNTLVVVALKDGAPQLHYQDEGEYRDGAAARNTDITAPLSIERYQQLWSDLMAAGALEHGADLIGDERRRRVGVSFNFLSFELGDAKARIDYLRTLLDEDSPEHAPQRALIALVKELGRSVAPK